jgi:hypothetical protein
VGFLLIAAAAGCSGSGDSGKPADAPAQPPESTADIGRLYDPSRLVELRSLRGYPEDLQALLGVHATGNSRIADVGEDCHVTDVPGPGPGRCFVLGGISRTSALVAFKGGGRAGQFLTSAAYVRDKAGWVLLWQRRVGPPASLVQLIEMTSVAADDRPPATGFDKCFRMVEGRCSY